MREREIEEERQKDMEEERVHKADQQAKVHNFSARHGHRRERKPLSPSIVTRHASFRMGRACNGSSITDLWTKLKRPVAVAGRRGRSSCAWREWGEVRYTPIFLDISRERISLSLSLRQRFSTAVCCGGGEKRWRWLKRRLSDKSAKFPRISRPKPSLVSAINSALPFCSIAIDDINRTGHKTATEREGMGNSAERTKLCKPSGEKSFIDLILRRYTARSGNIRKNMEWFFFFFYLWIFSLIWCVVCLMLLFDTEAFCVMFVSSLFFLVFFFL